MCNRSLEELFPENIQNQILLRKVADSKVIYRKQCVQYYGSNPKVPERDLLPADPGGISHRFTAVSFK